jgi:hypothetical protein
MMAATTAEYDLTSKIIPFFDLHLVIPLIEFIEPRKVRVFYS